MFAHVANKVLSGTGLTKDDAREIASADGADVTELFAQADKIRRHYRGNVADLCSIVSAKTGACPEDCAYCSQSARSKAEVKRTKLIAKGEVLKRAEAAKRQGARRFCVVTSGKKATGGELEKIAEMVSGVRGLGLLPCATLGLLAEDELSLLRDAGLHRYHHNLETSRRYFPEICSTHTYDDKLATVGAAERLGLSVCSGGIFGMGETWDDRIDMAFELRELGVDSVPVNFLVPVKGTPLGHLKPISPMEALKIVSLFRFILPDKEIRVCGGRLQTLGEFNSWVFLAGADGLLTGDCLTVSGRKPEDDLRLIEEFGLTV
jgi:biotin synthase